MILNTKYDEEVNGSVVGRYQLICSLRYDGRKQGSMMFWVGDVIRMYPMSEVAFVELVPGAA